MRSNKPGTAIDTSPSIPPASLDQIVLALQQVDTGLFALIDLLEGSHRQISAEGIAALIRPHADLLRQASAALNDVT